MLLRFLGEPQGGRSGGPFRGGSIEGQIAADLTAFLGFNPTPANRTPASQRVADIEATDSESPGSMLVADGNEAAKELAG